MSEGSGRQHEGLIAQRDVQMHLQHKQHRGANMRPHHGAFRHWNRTCKSADKDCLSWCHVNKSFQAVEADRLRDALGLSKSLVDKQML